MPRDATVDAWFETRKPAQAALMQRVRDLVLAADARVGECIKWQQPTFTYQGNIASFTPAKAHVSLMFHTGATIPGEHPELTGDGAQGRVMRFEDADDLDAKADALQRVVRAWCDSRGSGRR